jgi:hypothetical protein
MSPREAPPPGLAAGVAAEPVEAVLRVEVRDFSKVVKSASNSGDALAATRLAVTSYSLSTVNRFLGIRISTLLSPLSAL